MSRMDASKFMKIEGEKPLENLVTDGGFCGIFRTVAVIGDSLSSGEFEKKKPDGTNGYYDFFDYSWGQYMARMGGFKCINMSRGGMTAMEYIESFAEQKGYYSPDLKAQAYIIAMGVNDFFYRQPLIEKGSVADICKEDYTKNAKTFIGYYGQIIQRYKEIEPDAKFFLVTQPYASDRDADRSQKSANMRSAILELAEFFDNCYVIDLFEYGPDYNAEFRKAFFLNGHMNPMGYVLTAKLMLSYIDYIIRHNPDDFKNVGFIGTGI